MLFCWLRATVCIQASGDPEGYSQWNEHTYCLLTEWHGLDVFIAGQNFPGPSGAQGQRSCSPVSTLITYGIPLRAHWVLSVII